MLRLVMWDLPVSTDSAEGRTLWDFSDYKPAFSISADQQVPNRVVGAYCRSSELVNPLSILCPGRRHSVHRFRPWSENRRRIPLTPDESDTDQFPGTPFDPQTGQKHHKSGLAGCVTSRSATISIEPPAARPVSIASASARSMARPHLRWTWMTRPTYQRRFRSGVHLRASVDTGKGRCEVQKAGCELRVGFRDGCAHAAIVGSRLRLSAVINGGGKVALRAGNRFGLGVANWTARRHSQGCWPTQCHLDTEADSAPPANARAFHRRHRTILDDDCQVPRKQCHTAESIIERHREEYAFAGRYTIVNDCAREHRRGNKEMFVPLSRPPGHSRRDFGDAPVVVAGEQKVPPSRLLSSLGANPDGQPTAVTAPGSVVAAFIKLG